MGGSSHPVDMWQMRLRVADIRLYGHVHMAGYPLDGLTLMDHCTRCNVKGRSGGTSNTPCHCPTVGVVTWLIHARHGACSRSGVQLPQRRVLPHRSHSTGAEVRAEEEQGRQGWRRESHAPTRDHVRAGTHHRADEGRHGAVTPPTAATPGTCTSRRACCSCIAGGAVVGCGCA